MLFKMMNQKLKFLSLVIVTTAGLLLNGISGSRNKPIDMTMLILIPITGDEPRIGEACKVASQIVIDEVNSRRDILPDYHLVPIYEDEGPSSHYAPKAAVDFRRRWEENGELQSPVMVGPYYSAGCMAVSPAIPYLDMAHVGVSCSTPLMSTNRKKYPNLYRARSGNELAAYAYLRFIRDIGKWNRFGIVTTTNNIGDYTMALTLSSEGPANGFQIPFFEMVPDVSEQVIASLMQADVRIVAVQFSQPPLVVKFLCYAYKIGMTGAKYAFVLIYTAFMDPDGLPDVIFPGCTRDIVSEQLKYSVWIAWASWTDEPAVKTSLGYDLFEFDNKFDVALKGAPHPLDYDRRVMCHDAVVQAIVALNDSGIPLASYRDNPNLAMATVNESMAKVDYVGLRVGHFQFSQRLELDDDLYAAVQWTPEGKQRVLYTFRRRPGAPVFNYTSYTVVHPINEPKWTTADGKPPRDQLLTNVERSTMSATVIGLITTVWILTILAQTAIWLASLKQSLNNPLQQAEGFRVDKFAVTLGCILFDLAAILFLILDVTAVCLLQRACVVLAFALMQGALLFRLIYRQITIGQVHITPSTANTATLPLPPIEPLHVTPQKRFLTLSTLTTCIISIAYLAIWFSVDPVVLSFDSISRYNAKTDTMNILHVHRCSSKRHETIWITLFVAIHAGMLILGSCVAVNLRKTIKTIGFLDIDQTRLAIWFLTTLVFAACLVVALQASDSYNALMIVLSIFSLLFSIATSLALFWPNIRMSFGASSDTFTIQAIDDLGGSIFNLQPTSGGHMTLRLHC